MSKPKRKLRRRILLVLATFGAVLIVAVAVLVFTSSAMTVLVGVNVDEKVEHVNHDVTANETIGADDYSTVYLTREITPEAIMEMYEKLGVEANGNVAVKLSTGEAGNDYHLDANLIKDLVMKSMEPLLNVIQPIQDKEPVRISICKWLKTTDSQQSLMSISWIPMAVSRYRLKVGNI